MIFLCAIVVSRETLVILHVLHAKVAKILAIAVLLLIFPGVQFYSNDNENIVTNNIKCTTQISTIANFQYLQDQGLYSYLRIRVPTCLVEVLLRKTLQLQK